jgi:hypothetical protein
MMLRIGILASSIAKSFKDLFSRTTSGSLGDPGNGATWLATKGTWFANGSQAQSNDAASTYPIASVDMYSPNVEISATVENKPGVGVSFWVVDSNNWWGAYQFQAINTSYAQACGSYVQTGPSYFCGASTAYNYSYCSSSSSFTYTYCSVPVSYSFQQCNGSSSYTYSYCAQVSSFNFSYCSDVRSQSTSVCNSSNGPFYYSNCAAYSRRYDGFRDLYFAGCDSYSQGGPFYFCNSYTSQTTYFCGGFTSGTGYTCNALGTGTAYTCTGGYSTQTGYNCGGTAQATGYTCTGTSSATGYTCTNTVGPNYGQSCNSYFQSSSNSAGQRYFRFIKSVANTITTVVDQSISSTISSIKVILLGNTITAKIYSDSTQNAQVGSDITTTDSSSQKATRHGLLLAPGGWEQAKTIDDISIKI